MCVNEGRRKREMVPLPENTKPNTVIWYDIVIDKLGKNGRQKEALERFKKMAKKGALDT